jgi:hypothetical protein
MSGHMARPQASFPPVSMGVPAFAYGGFPPAAPLLPHQSAALLGAHLNQPSAMHGMYGSHIGYAPVYAGPTGGLLTPSVRHVPYVAPRPAAAVASAPGVQPGAPGQQPPA